MTNSLEDRMRKALVKSIVQRAIFCTVSGNVLDIRTCVVVLDSDGDPAAVFSPEGYKTLKAISEEKDADLLASGYTFDPSTLPA